MTDFQQPSWAAPAAPSAGSTPAADPSAAERRSGNAADLLSLADRDPRRETRRVTLALVGVALISAVVVNISVYESERASLEQRRREQFGQRTDVRHTELRERFRQLHRQVAYAAGQPALVAAAEATAAPDVATLATIQRELDRVVARLDVDGVAILAGDGTLIAASGREAGTVSVSERALIEVVRRRGPATVGGIRTLPDGHQVVETAAAIGGTGGAHGWVLVASTYSDEALRPLLRDWVRPGVAMHLYLVRQEGSEVVYLTRPERGAPPGDRAPLSQRAALPAAMAATGVESDVEITDAQGRILWATTRHLPELGWGLVAEVSRDALLAELRATILRLIAIDVALALLVLGGVGYWRRQYALGLERREVQVTQRHAARVQAVLDTAFDAILTFDRGGRVRTVNRAAERMFGRPAAELEGQPLHRLLHWGGAGARAGAPGLPPTGVVCIAEARRGDGVVFPAEFSLGQAGEDEELVYTAIVRDVSERVEAERRIRAFAEGLEASNHRLEEVNLQLQEASRLKSEFLANTSHELRTPLNGMIGFLQLVLDGLCETREEEREFLKQGLQCSRHLLGLINDVLDIAKIEAGKLTVESEKADILDLFAEVETVTHVQAQQAGIHLRFVPPTDDSVYARCDIAKTKQVLINLIGNSLKFTPKGSITVRATAHPDLGHVMFEVIDTGIGIPPDRQKLIFEKFTQGDGSTTRKYGGTGLGLAISRSLVELMGGIIGVHSEGEGKGTRMYFSLPVWDEGAGEVPDAAAPPDTDQIEGPANGSLVLVVEDDPAFRRFLTVLLHQHGYRTVAAAHAEGAWVLVRRLRPAVVVLDYALSCAEGATLRTGWDLAERITSDPETRHTALIFVTGFDTELREKLRATAFSRKPAHLMKPVDGPALLSRIEEMVGTVVGRQVRLLMADDDPTVAAFVRKVLPEDRFHIEVANNGEECLHVLRTQPRGFDLLLLDLMMPEVSGYDVLREMTLAGTASDLPVVVLTNFPEARNPDEQRLLEHGLVLDVLPKTAVHDSPQLLAHIIDWHVQVALEGGTGPEERAA